MTETYSNPLQTVLDEFKILSPETTNVLIFKNNGQTIANTQATTEDQTKKLIANFGSISIQAQSIGGIECLTIHTCDSQLNITAMGNLYLATVSSREANQEIVKSLTQVVVPTIARFVNKLESSNSENRSQQTIQLKELSIEENALPLEDEKPNIEPIPCLLYTSDAADE